MFYFRILRLARNFRFQSLSCNNTKDGFDYKIFLILIKLMFLSLTLSIIVFAIVGQTKIVYIGLN